MFIKALSSIYFKLLNISYRPNFYFSIIVALVENVFVPNVPPNRQSYQKWELSVKCAFVTHVLMSSIQSKNLFISGMIENPWNPGIRAKNIYKL